MANRFSKITPEILELSSLFENNSRIDPSYYDKYDVKRGLRDINGKGVLTGLTVISEIISSKIVDGKEYPCEGKLYYRGIDVEEIVEGFIKEDRFGYEEVAYLLLFGELPDAKRLEDFNRILANYRSLPTNFVRDIIMKAPSHDMMNTLARSVLTMYSYDDYADDNTLPNVLRQSLQLIALFPLLSVYGYQAYCHYHDKKSLFIHRPQPELSTAENILYILRPDSKYTPLEAKILDLALVLHAEHGGGNNSTFTTHVVTSSGTDTYSAITAALCSLKGPRHGGANIKVVQMFDDMKTKISDWTDEGEVADYLERLLDKKEFDRSGLIYGMGHAVYSLSDPRATMLKKFVESLSKEKDRMDEFRLYSLVEKLAPEIIRERRRIYKGVSANVDFYSGFVYNMLGLPLQLFTPLFAIARIPGWAAHRMEEIANAGKIIRPAYKSVSEKRDYIPLDAR
ncbi:MAG: citrate/2-methylcitrate synthase [Acetivibrionales bacterium]|jgi:citrate synthase|nr:citrate/2-methylcitrate synthase [Bacillota bacterium]NLP06597.1 citrate/2-methylcitrate synthase [Clostridiaceae bacterium]HOA54728.1 citrate/2-methylcitrate synthase [Clostridiales bacterium]HPZ04747.1 citrate/2-methylcitrate synthase [Clostridiales bacterium]HQD30843.1 citrate/2-methylcitrate synthase [Clostridiales bacterium]